MIFPLVYNVSIPNTDDCIVLKHSTVIIFNSDASMENLIYAAIVVNYNCTVFIDAANQGNWSLSIK